MRDVLAKGAVKLKGHMENPGFLRPVVLGDVTVSSLCLLHLVIAAVGYRL